MASGIASIKVTINGTDYSLTESSTAGVWTASAAAPSQTSGSNNSGSGPGVGTAAAGLGYYPCTVTVTDIAGNVTTINTTTASLGDALKLKVKETVKPTCTITYPSNNAYVEESTPTFKWHVDDSGSGVKTDTCYIKIDSGTAVAGTLDTSSSTDTVKYFTYTPSAAIADGSHTIQVYGSDYDGNTSATVSSSFKVDTLPPALSISLDSSCVQPTSEYSGDKYLTKNTSITVSGTTSDANGVTISITGGSAGPYSPSVGTGGAFSQAISLNYGTNTITVTATDGHGRTTVLTRTIVMDNIAPKVTKITLTPNPVNTGANWSISVTVTDPDS